MEQIPSLQLPFKASATQMTQGYFVGNSKQKIIVFVIIYSSFRGCFAFPTGFAFKLFLYTFPRVKFWGFFWEWEERLKSEPDNIHCINLKGDLYLDQSAVDCLE